MWEESGDDYDLTINNGAGKSFEHPQSVFWLDSESNEDL